MTMNPDVAPRAAWRPLLLVMGSALSCACGSTTNDENSGARSEAAGAAGASANGGARSEAAGAAGAPANGGARSETAGEAGAPANGGAGAIGSGGSTSTVHIACAYDGICVYALFDGDSAAEVKASCVEQEHGTVLEHCAIANLLGCCGNELRTSCYYPDAAQPRTASTCSSGDTWSEVPP